MPQLQFGPSVPAADKADLSAIAAKMFASVDAINAFLAQSNFHYVCGFEAVINVTMDHATYPGGRLEQATNWNKHLYAHLWQVPALGGLTTNDRETVYLAPAALYWVGLPPHNKKSAVDRLIHEMVHASIPGIAGPTDPHRPAFYLTEKHWFSLLGRPWPSAEQDALTQAQHA